MKKALGIALAGLVLAAGGLVSAEDKSDARAIIDKAVKAAGGEANLAKYKAMTWKETGTYYGVGGDEGVPYTGDYAVQWPDKARMDIEGVFTLVLDGDKGWIKQGGETKEMTREQLAEHQEGNYAGWVATLAPLKDKAFTLKPLGEVKVDGRPAVGVKVSHKGHRDISLFFDKESGLLAKSEYKARAMEDKGKEVNQEVWYSNYKEIGGIKVPMKVLIKRDGKRFVEGSNMDVKPLEKLPASTFAKP